MSKLDRSQKGKQTLTLKHNRGLHLSLHNTHKLIYDFQPTALLKGIEDVFEIYDLKGRIYKLNKIQKRNETF